MYVPAPMFRYTEGFCQKFVGLNKYDYDYL